MGDVVEVTERDGSARTIPRRITTADLPTVSAAKVNVLRGLELVTVTPAVQTGAPHSGPGRVRWCSGSPRKWSSAVGLVEERCHHRDQAAPASPVLSAGLRGPGRCGRNRSGSTERGGQVGYGPLVPMIGDRWQSPLGQRLTHRRRCCSSGARPIASACGAGSGSRWRRRARARPADSRSGARRDAPASRRRGPRDGRRVRKEIPPRRDGPRPRVRRYQAPAARAFIHLGATSAFVTDSRPARHPTTPPDDARTPDLAGGEAGQLCGNGTRRSPVSRTPASRPGAAHSPWESARRSGPRTWRSTSKPALAPDRDPPVPRLQGHRGTQASFLDLFDGDHEKVRELDRLVTERMRFSAAFSVSGQTYRRGRPTAPCSTP